MRRNRILRQAFSSERKKEGLTTENTEDTEGKEERGGWRPVESEEWIVDRGEDGLTTEITERERLQT